jgi:F-type H+-transporting ATPase subunit b
MPQLDVSTFPTQLVWLFISFVVLYVLMATIGLPRLTGIIEARRGRIDGDLDKAAKMKAETEAVISAYERALADARLEAQQLLKETTDRLNAEAAERQQRVVTELATETAAAERRIAEVKAVALGNVRDMAFEVAVAAAAKLAGGKVDAGRAAAAVEAAMRERR